jgi:hypothetical protein
LLDSGAAGDESDPITALSRMIPMVDSTNTTRFVSGFG